MSKREEVLILLDDESMDGEVIGADMKKDRDETRARILSIVEELEHLVKLHRLEIDTVTDTLGLPRDTNVDAIVACLGQKLSRVEELEREVERLTGDAKNDAGVIKARGIEITRLEAELATLRSRGEGETCWWRRVPSFSGPRYIADCDRGQSRLLPYGTNACPSCNRPILPLKDTLECIQST